MDKLEASLDILSRYCVKEEYKGFDPYDGLNSTLFRFIPFAAGSRLVRLAWIQFFKLSPLNLRSFFLIKKDYNPKALALFLSGYCNIYNKSKDQETYKKIIFFTDKLLSLVSKGWSGPCWGYNFDWQAKAFFQPSRTPMVVVTSFVGHALLDAYKITGDKSLLEVVRSSCNFILSDLNRSYDPDGNFAFSYSPLDRSVVYNASLLGSRLLARVYSITGESCLIEAARSSVAFCCNKQNPDGSWSYGNAHFHQWIDNFHTGYNLECLSDYIRFSGDNYLLDNLEKGFAFYIKTFFRPDGVPKYYNNSVYPVDVHSAAQLIITLSKLDKLIDYKDLAEKVLNWTVDNMQSPKGYFYYQKNKYFTNKISYMRWSQAWMCYALSEYILKIS
jgi:hypothetical protein